MPPAGACVSGPTTGRRSSEYGLSVRHALGEALALKAERRDAVPIAGGTDLMVELDALPPLVSVDATVENASTRANAPSR